MTEYAELRSLFIRLGIAFYESPKPVKTRRTKVPVLAVFIEDEEGSTFCFDPSTKKFLGLDGVEWIPRGYAA